MPVKSATKNAYDAGLSFVFKSLLFVRGLLGESLAFVGETLYVRQGLGESCDGSHQGHSGSEDGGECYNKL
jgi:hypothetical protein